MNKAALKAVAKLTHIDLVSAVKSKRHNPILDSEIHIEEELINLKESFDTYYTAEESIRNYPQMHIHVTREKRAIMKHCIGLVIRMINGNKLPRPYTKHDIDFAVRRLVQTTVEEARRAGRKLDDDVMEIFRPYLSLRQRIALRDFTKDMVIPTESIQRAQALVGKLPILRSR
ncbi:MAG: hypothetical protein JWP13_294 [Candidatus Saccharibacteria bacterium]|nr:hypothetical protein [Candidatus Saccharibacteria bacterium]